MRKTAEAQTWVVYQALLGKQAGNKSVCELSEWEAIETSKPGQNKLIKRDIVTEGEADKLARGTSGDAKKRGG